MAHTLMAYLSFCKGIQYIWEACKHPCIKLIALRALMESSIAMSEEHEVPLKTLYEHSEDLLYRFGNKLLGDTTSRVGKDPIRKLSKDDRMIGAGLICLKHGVKPVYISLGIAAGFAFSPPDDELAIKVQESLSVKGIENSIKEICHIDSSNLMFEMIVEFYSLLTSKVEIEVILEKAEKMKILKRDH